MPIHQDRKEKIFTMVLYLSDDKTPKPYGTTFYTKSGKDFQEVQSFKYCANTAIFILNPNEHYHGVKDFPLLKDKNTLQLFLSKKLEF